MCSVSAVSDHYGKWPGIHRDIWTQPNTLPTSPLTDPIPVVDMPDNYKKLYEDVLKRNMPNVGPFQMTMEELIKVLQAFKDAREYDVAHNEPDCVDPQKAVVFDALIQNCADKIAACINEGDAAKALELTSVMERFIKLKAEVLAGK